MTLKLKMYDDRANTNSIIFVVMGVTPNTNVQLFTENVPDPFTASIPIVADSNGNFGLVYVMNPNSPLQIMLNDNDDKPLSVYAASKEDGASNSVEVSQ